MVKERVFFINNKLKGNTHEIIDASLIMALANLFGRVEIYLSHSRRVLLEEMCFSFMKQNDQGKSFEKCVWREINIDVKSDFFLDLYVALVDAWLLIKGSKRDIFMFSYGNSRFSLYLVNFLSKLLKRKVIICAHNELDVLVKEKYPLNPNWYYLINRFYRKTQWSKNLRFLVLGDFIIDNLRKTLSADRVRHFFSVDHPYFQTQDDEQENPNIGNLERIRVGLVGTVAPNKGLDNLKSFVASLENSNVELRVISRVLSPEDIFSNNAHVKIMNPDGLFLSREKYDELISDVDYLFFPYPNDRFCFSVSGSIFESIAKRKPFIAFRNDHFSYLLNKYGEFGIVINEKDQLNSLICSLSDTKRYMKMVHNCSDIAKKLSPIKCDLSRVLDFYGDN